jgi:hypothetical protein
MTTLEEELAQLKTDMSSVRKELLHINKRIDTLLERQNKIVQVLKL